MNKELWKVVDKLELVAMPNFFEAVAIEIEVKKAIAMLKDIIKQNEDDLK